MKKINTGFGVFALGMLILALFIVSTLNAHAAIQTTSGVSCPFGYVCTPVSTTIPIINYPTTAPVANNSTSCYTFQRNISVGTTMTSDEASNLNSVLAADGEGATLATDNQYTADQARTISAYQAKNNLPSTGYFGPLTRASVNATACSRPVQMSAQSPAMSPTAVRNFSYYDLLNTGGLCTTQPVQSQIASNSATAKLFNLDFGPQLPNPTSQEVGPAVVGSGGDFWNIVSVPWCDDHVRTGLKNADGSQSSIAAELTNLGGSWASSASGGHLGIADTMLDSFAYPANNKGGNAIVTLTNVPAGSYDLYLYNKTITASQNGDYTVNVGSRGYGQKLTSTDPNSPQTTSWQEGNQYVKFPGITVNAGDPVTILIQPGVGAFHDSQISGLQLVPTNTVVNPPPTTLPPGIANLHLVDLSTGQNTFGLHAGTSYKAIWTGQNLTSPTVVSLMELQGTAWVKVMDIGTANVGLGSVTWNVPTSFTSSGNRYAITAVSGNVTEQIEVQFAAPVQSAPILPMPIQPAAPASPSGASINVVRSPVQPSAPAPIHDTDASVQPDTRSMAQ